MPFDAIFWLAPLAMVITLTLGGWLVLANDKPASGAVASLGVGAALLVLACSVYCIYALPRAHPLQGSFAPAALALLVFVAVFGFHFWKHRPSPRAIGTSFTVGLIALYCVGVAIWLWVACLMGDCL